jgi:hypothetical protein
MARLGLDFYIVTKDRAHGAIEGHAHALYKLTIMEEDTHGEPVERGEAMGERRSEWQMEQPRDARHPATRDTRTEEKEGQTPRR